MLLLRLPAFFFAIWLMYWSLPLGVLALYIPVWKLTGPRNDTFYWVEFLVNALGIRFRKRGEGELYRGPGPVLYMANHRSWADFFVDAYLAGGRAQMLSRMAVVYVFPAFMLPVVSMRGCIVFKRGSIKDKEGFNKWLDQKIARSPQAGLMVYPEGHRSTLPQSLPLKRGMLHYAYGRKLPVQIIMSGNKESVISEKTLGIGFGCTVVTSYSPVINSADYATFDAFMEKLQATWDAEWAATMNADPAGLDPLVLSGAAAVEPYPAALKISQLLWTALAGALLVATTVLSWRALVAATAVLGPQAHQPVLALLVAWFGASMVYCWDSSPPKPRAAAAGATKGGAAAAGRAVVAEARAAGGAGANGLHNRKGSS